MEFVEWDLAKPNAEIFDGVSEIYHLAAFPDVKLSAEMTKAAFEGNVTATFNVLEGCRAHGVKKIVFASTSAVYGVAPLPTPEDHPLNAISNYAATKVAGEAMIRSYSETYGIVGVALRFANVFGPRSKRGVMHDFYCKLKNNPKKLEILGDGKQSKAYLYIDDCLNAIEIAARHTKKKYEAYNVGSEKQVVVDDIASIVMREMGLGDVRIEYTGGEQGWIGDVPNMLLDISKLKKLGWKPDITTKEGMRLYIKWLEENVEGQARPSPQP